MPLAAAWSTLLPVEMSPVSDTMRTAGWEISAAPTLSPRPITRLKTPSGRRSAASLANFSAVSGVCSEGFSTIVLPAAIAGATFQASIMSG